MSNPSCIPKGILYQAVDNKPTIVFHCRPSAISILFLVVWLSLWTLLCLNLLQSYVDAELMSNGEPVSLGFISLFLVAEFIAIYGLMYELFSVKTITFKGDYLTIITKVGIICWQRSYDLSRAHCIELCYDFEKSKDKDWDLSLSIDKSRCIVGSQPYEQLAWIADTIKSWTHLKIIETK